jgi:AraC-type DNA-binding domain-containing proteins
MQKYDYFLEPERIDPADGAHIHNVGFSQCPPAYTYGWETRDYYLIHYIISGKGSFFANGKKYSLVAKQGFLITPGSTIMHLSDIADPWHLCWVGFNGEHVERYLKSAHLDECNLIFDYPQNEVIESSIMNIYSNVRTPSISNITLIGNLYILLGTLVDNTRIHSLKTSQIPLTHFERATRYIKHNIRSPISVDFLASEHDISPSALYRSFKNECGLSPKQYLDKQKIKKACELIKKTDFSFREISAYLGYEYETHFYKIFKKVVGMRPTEYKHTL